MGDAGRLVAAALMVLSAAMLAACGGSSEALSSAEEHAVVETVEGDDDLRRVTLTERAVERLGIVTTPVTQQEGARGAATPARRLVVPYGAVIYDPSGGTWVYRNDQPRSFVRSSITVDYIEGDVAVLTQGPPEGTQVASVGGAELYGAEVGIDH